MKLKRILAAGFFSLTLAVSGVAYVAPVAAENDTESDPIVHEAEAKNTGGTAIKEAGDSVVIEFSETTNGYDIDATNIMTEFELSSGHTFLDGNGAVGDVSWSDDFEKLTIVFTDGGSLPTVAAGDTVTYIGENIKDLEGNVVTGEAVIEGSFTAEADEDECVEDEENEEENEDEDDSDEDEDEDDSDEEENEDEDTEEEINASISGSNSGSNRGSNKDKFRFQAEDDEDEDDEDEDCDDEGDEHGKYRCGSGLQNGRLYRVEGSQTVYLMAACRLKPFRGIAAFNSRGLKFQDIQTLSALPSNVSISDKPALPADGTLVKGSDATVWFMAKNGKRKGFTSAEVFLGLGFKFEEVDQISDSDLGTVEADTDVVDDSNEHPDGALIKCGNSPEVFKVIDNIRFPFANVEAFQGRGHSFDKILVVDCGRFAYLRGPALTE